VGYVRHADKGRFRGNFWFLCNTARLKFGHFPAAPASSFTILAQTSTVVAPQGDMPYVSHRD
jgi:hypothetical protein